MYILSLFQTITIPEAVDVRAPVLTTSTQTVQTTPTVRQRRWANTTPEVRHELNINRRKHPTPSQYAARNVTSLPNVHNLGSMSSRCSDCNAMHFEKEKNTRGKFSSCCGSGTIKPQCLTPYPDSFKSWLTEDDYESKNFRVNIRKYNSAVAFASFGYQPAKLSRGLPVFVIHGQVHHQTSASSGSSEKPAYSQLYFLDPEFANNERMANQHNSGCIASVMESLGIYKN